MEGSIARGKDDGKRVGDGSGMEEVEDEGADMAGILSVDGFIGDDIVVSEERKDMIVQEGGAGAVAADGIAYDEKGHRDASK